MTQLCALTDRGVLEVAGADRVDFLQGLVSNDVAQAAPGRCVWAALLTPQGKYLADFFIFAEDGRLLLDCARAQAAGLLQRLTRHRLRARVTIAERRELSVFAAWGDAAPATLAIRAPDPRLPAAGWRLLAAAMPTNAEAADWDRHRIALGLPDGERDLEVDKTVLLEAGFDELHGVSWSKGCYMGQELTARTKYRGLLKRRLLPVRIAGTVPPSGTPVVSDGAEVGTMRSTAADRGLAVLRLDALGKELRCGEAVLEVVRPEWLAVPEAAE